jgi:perosamine synthetase
MQVPLNTAGVPIQAESRSLDLPRLPVLHWRALSWGHSSPVPSVIDLPHVTFVRSGRAAIALALATLAIGKGDRVLVPTYHCPTMIAPVVAAGADLVFFPIDERGAPRLDAIDPRSLSGVRAMLAAHYFGLPQSFAAVRAFCDTHKIAFIEDCAHALFGLSDGKPVGSSGDFAIASLTKFLPLAGGGCLAAMHCGIDMAVTRRPLHD